MQRVTKLFIVAWAIAAVAFEVRLVARGWGDLELIAAGAFVTMFVLGSWSRRAVAPVLAVAYVLPALVTLAHGDYFIFFGVAWMAALLGAIAPDGLRRGWNLPQPWRPALICWALVVAVGTPLTAWREIDFDPALLGDTSPWILWSSQLGVAPSFVVAWVVYVGLVLVLGILWFDWLFSLSPEEFRYGVATPLLAGAGVMAAVAAYQFFGHMLFLNETIFGNMGRASGTMRDANLCGAIAALWAGGVIVLSDRLDRARPIAITGGVGLAVLAVWAAGSRTGLALMLVVAVFALAGLCLGRGRSGRRVIVYACAGGAILLMLLVVVAHLHPEATGPVQRAAAMLPTLSAESLRNFASELWNRNRYGAAAVAMIRDFPLVGIGVGAYQILVPDYAAVSSPGGSIIADNAQNWYRHQLAEFGVLGSFGWMLWLALFAWFVFRRPKRNCPALSLWTSRGVLVGLALVSLVGMPTQDVVLAITFWTFAFWYTTLAGAPPSPTRSSWLTWAAIFIVVIVYAAGTVTASVTRLRPPLRAQRFGWSYVYGFYDPEPDGHGGEFRWTGRRATSVLEQKSAWLELTVSTTLPDLAEKPADARIWVNRRLVLRTRMRTSSPTTEYVHLSTTRAVLLETAVNRTMRPSDYGTADDRELGMMVSWKFTDGPPAGATVATTE